MIFSASAGMAIGLVLSNCVYGRNGKLSGKFFDDTFRTSDGLITGKLKSGPVPYIDQRINQPIISELLLHSDSNPCGWISALDEWAPMNFDEYMQLTLLIVM